MSIRGVWILSTPSLGGGSTEGCLLFSRIYQTVEKKMKMIHGNDFVPLPSNPELVTALLYELGYDVSAKFATVRDSCTKEDEKPVLEIVTSAGKHWPVVIVEQYSLLFCCIPMVDSKDGKRPPIIEIPGVTLGFSLLCVLADYLRSTTASEIRVFDIYSFLSLAAPFGSPVDVNLESILAKLANKVSPVPKSQKQPAWKPVLHKGKNQIYLAITEYMRAVQYGKEDAVDLWDLYGTVTCKAELEGAMPDITLNLSHSLDGNSLPLDHLIIHPCVQSADAALLETGPDLDVRPSPRRLRFTPPAEMFTLCHYTVPRVKQLAVTGTYDVTGDLKSLSVDVKLKLNETVRNSFEYCELQMPFYNRGAVVNYEANPNHGNVMLSPDRRVFVWNIGAKFPSKSLEVHLSANLQFGDVTKPAASYDESFCTGLNTYAQLYFKITNFAHSGCLVDPKSVQVSPNVKYKLTTVREYMSTGYKIWNCNGDVLTSTPPPSLTDVT